MKRIIILLCSLCFVLAYAETAFAPPASKPVPVTTTLNDIPPVWSKTLQCDTTACPRFDVVMGGVAVLDHETGLVWEQSPSPSAVDWINAVRQCIHLKLGGRKGWHLPTIEQLTSLLDTPVTLGPGLPAGHPFTLGERASHFWSATTDALANDGA